MLRNFPQKEIQYIIPFLLIVLGFILTDFLGIFEKSTLSYWSGRLLYEPYRVITTHFVHGDTKHLLANTFGIVVSRYSLNQLGIKNNYFFVLLVAFLIPLQVFIFWALDIFIFHNLLSLAIGFSGIIFGIHGFILLTSIYGKKNFLGIEITCSKNLDIRRIMLTLLTIGFIWSFVPGISFAGHLSGFLAGLILFLL